MPTIAVFSSARDVVRADKICRDNAISAKVMPLPEYLSSECGMCLYLRDRDIEKAKRILETQKIYPSIYQR